MSSTEEFQVQGLTVRIQQDEDYESPREWGTHGKMICWHRKYNLGDDHDYKTPQDFFISLFDECDPSGEDVRKIIAELIKDEDWQEDYRKFFVSNMHYSTRDSIRYDYLREVMENDGLPRSIHEMIQEVVEEKFLVLPLYLYDHSGITMNTTGFSCRWDSGKVGYIYAAKDSLEDPSVELEKVLISEVEVYDQYLTGDVWGYVIEDESGCELDSCWGHYGYDYCTEEAKSQALYYASQVNRPTYDI